MNIYIHENMKQVTRIRHKTEDNPPMANVPLIGYSKKIRLLGSVSIQKRRQV